MDKDVLKEIELCDECGVCINVCPIYEVTGKELFTPISRIKAAEKVFKGNIPSEAVELMYNCPECGRCEEVCPNEVKITKIVEVARNRLIKKGFVFDAHKRIAKWIVELGNSVGKEPEKRLEWLPEEFKEKESNTLLYLGCLPSYLIKNIAKTTYTVLKRAEVDFMILEDEGCCGVYLYDAGMVELAEEVFTKNAERFEKIGVEKIITPCAGCYRCFKRYYPRVLGKTDFEVYHVVEVIDELVRDKKLSLKKKEMQFTYHDPCRLGRKEGLYEEPRRILRECVEIAELKENRDMGMCCGAGAGIRSIYRDLSMEVAAKLLNSTQSNIITSCPFCTFNLNYAAKKKGIDKEVKYITELLVD